MARLKPKTVLITGASSGIGREIALEYARRGAHVMAAARRESELASLVSEIERSGGKASFSVCDVGDGHSAVELVKKAHAELGSLDMVIANAGVGGNAHSSRISLDSVWKMIDINVRGALALLVAAIPIMVEQKRGQLVGVSSLAGRRGLPTSAVYSATKAAVSTFLESVRIDLAGTGVYATDVQPGFVATPMTAKNDFPMPFIWDASKAAQHIVSRLERAPRVIAFPLPLDLLTRLSRQLPHSLFASISTRMLPKSSRRVRASE